MYASGDGHRHVFVAGGGFFGRNTDFPLSRRPKSLIFFSPHEYHTETTQHLRSELFSMLNRRLPTIIDTSTSKVANEERDDG